MLRSVLAGAFLLAAVSVGTAQADTTYLGQRTVGPVTVNLSITTDGDTGVLGASDITNWDIGLTNGTTSFTLDPTDSTLKLFGSALSATPSDLTFDFDSGAPNLLDFTVPATGSSFWCIGQNGNCNGLDNPPAENADVNNAFPDTFGSVNQSGSQVATSSVSAAPEPSTWALMLIGVGLIGTVLRRSKARTVLAA